MPQVNNFLINNVKALSLIDIDNFLNIQYEKYRIKTNQKSKTDFYG